jgi:hypothetical protein
MFLLLYCGDDFLRVAEPHNVYAAPALSKIFDAALEALAVLAPTLQYSKAKVL